MHRYALYAAPPQTHPLHAFAAHWLGRDPQSGLAKPPSAAAGLPADRIAELTAEPRRYGFHATLKPPFQLAEGKDQTSLHQALQSFAASRGAPQPIALHVAALGNFLALRPSSSDAELRALADACVMELDGFRAPASETEIARRRAAKLNPRQDEYLLRWGYPYVLEEFRPHFTLTGRISDATERNALLGHLTEQLEPLLVEPMPIELCLYGQKKDADFHILARYPLKP